MTILKPLLVTLLHVASLLQTSDGSSTSSGSFHRQALNSTTATNSTKTTMMSNASEFSNVPLDTNEQTACSPDDPGIDWRGVLIRAPSRVLIPENGAQNHHFVIPICGLYLVDVANTFQHPGPKVLIVTDNTSGQVYKGSLVKRTPEPTVPPPRSRPVNPSTKLAFGEYFNINAATYVKIPIQHAIYRVKIEYAGYQSNEVTIIVTERP